MNISVQQDVLPIVVLSVMTTIGMELRWHQFIELLEAPRIPILGSIIHTLCFPAITALIILGTTTLNYPLSDATIIGMLLIAACPSGGFSNILALVARANLPLSVLLTSVSSILSFVTVPIFMAAFAFFMADLNEPIRLPVSETLLQLLILVLLPIGLGMLIRFKQDQWVTRHLARAQNVGQLALYVCVALIIAENWDVIIVGVGEALPWSLGLCTLNLFFCYQLANWSGLKVEDRITVALEGSIRNLAVALLIATTILQRVDVAVLPTVYFIAVMIIAMLFANTWRHLIPTTSQS